VHGSRISGGGNRRNPATPYKKRDAREGAPLLIG
jgi:hypothetical protein